ncbi:MAG: universal stress protein [Candidatus Rokuibacteriota bacterium]
MSRLRRIMHATDFSRASAPAFKWALELAKANRGQLLVVHVVTPPTLALPPEGYLPPTLYQSLEASARREALVGRARRAGVRTSAILLEGVPHERVARAARSKRADLLVIGTHGRSGLAKLFLGSVASRLVALAPRPVLTVRGR